MQLSKSKITLHVQEVGGYGGWEVQEMVNAHVRGAVTLDSPNYARKLHNELGSECCIVQRSKLEEEWAVGDGRNNLLLSNPEGYADVVFEHHYPLMQQTPFGYWQFPTDEFNIQENNVEQYNRANVRWLERMHEKGLHGAILGSPVGTPSNMSLLNKMKPALKSANDHGDIVHRHSYNSPHLTSHDPSYLILRQEREYDLLNAAVEFPKLRWFLTEIPWDRVEGNNYAGWKKGVTVVDSSLRAYTWYRDGMQPAEVAEHELFDWLDPRLQSKSWLIAAAFFCASTYTEWSEFNIIDSRTDFNLFPRFISRIKAQIPTGTEPAPIPPDPIPTPDTVAYLYKVVDCINLRMRRTPVFDSNDLSNVVDTLPVNSTPIIEKIEGVAAKLYGMELYVHRDFLQLIKSINV